MLDPRSDWLGLKHQQYRRAHGHFRSQSHSEDIPALRTLKRQEETFSMPKAPQESSASSPSRQARIHRQDNVP
ncbi:hypothetical protein Ciccas_001637 [Cichlidogyrus casuarinus]|uniref:Uncharacterized protein n=1 Tax=Cichlidogyrus casuarinus TaxID=1844966 RepID=A0ABD2QLS6_9PLAT